VGVSTRLLRLVGTAGAQARPRRNALPKRIQLPVDVRPSRVRLTASVKAWGILWRICWELYTFLSYLRISFRRRQDFPNNLASLEDFGELPPMR
jgi:hypothetical protein